MDIEIQYYMTHITAGRAGFEITWRKTKERATFFLC